VGECARTRERVRPPPPPSGEARVRAKKPPQLPRMPQARPLFFFPPKAALCPAGYTRVTEKVLENRVARTLPEDLLSAAVDGALWAANPNWPSKLAILRTLRDTHPDVFSDAEEVVRPIGRDAFLRLISEASGGRASQSDGNRLFRHYARFEVMLTQAADEGGSELESDPGRLEP